MAVVHTAEGAALLATGNFTAAIDKFDAAIASDPSCAPLQVSCHVLHDVTMFAEVFLHILASVPSSAPTNRSPSEEAPDPMAWCTYIHCHLSL